MEILIKIELGLLIVIIFLALIFGPALLAANVHPLCIYLYVIPVGLLCWMIGAAVLY